VSIEAHITLRHAPEADAALAAWLAQRAMKLAQVELSQGAAPRQTMITTWREAPVEEAVRDAGEIRNALAPLGIVVSRIKLEVPHAPGAFLAPALYIEHHVMVHVAVPQLAWLAQIGRAHGAHLSRNPRRRRVDGEERFLTQRFPPEAHHAAAAGLLALLEALRGGPASVLKIERERVVHDDNLALDAGWRPDISP
jgi:hypothetical protein